MIHVQIMIIIFGSESISSYKLTKLLRTANRINEKSNHQQKMYSSSHNNNPGSWNIPMSFYKNMYMYKINLKKTDFHRLQACMRYRWLRFFFTRTKRRILSQEIDTKQGVLEIVNVSILQKKRATQRED